MSDESPEAPDVAALFRWQAEGRGAWGEAADQAARLLAEVEAGRLEASPAELVALRTFVATVRGMGDG